MSTIAEWNQAEVIAAARAQVAENLAVAGKIVEVDARRRLLRIKAPEFGLKYRRILALYRLTSYMTAKKNEITAHIGIPRGPRGGDYGFWIEIGSRTAPAQPWLRPALMTKLRDIEELLNA